jgi:predicted SprT family Zn-dependent metalloprotease
MSSQLQDVKSLIKSVIDELIFEYPFLIDWSYQFDNAKKRAGVCKIQEKCISISLSHIENNELSVIKDTVLHEFAHAIAYELYKDSGHGLNWKHIAKKIGAIPKAKGYFNLAQSPWLLVHSCAKTFELKVISQRFRRNKKIKNYFLSGRPETKGELFFINQQQFKQYEQGFLDKSLLDLLQ